MLHYYYDMYFLPFLEVAEIAVNPVQTVAHSSLLLSFKIGTKKASEGKFSVVIITAHIVVKTKSRLHDGEIH